MTPVHVIRVVMIKEIPCDKGCISSNENTDTILGSNLLTPLPAARLYQIAENRSEFALHLQNGFDGHGLTGKISL